MLGLQIKEVRSIPDHARSQYDSVSSVQVTDHEIITGSLDSQIRRYDIWNREVIAGEMACKFSMHIQKVWCNISNKFCLFLRDPFIDIFIFTSLRQ